MDMENDAIEFHLLPSLIFRVILLFVYLGAAVSLSILVIPIFIKIVLFILLVYLCYRDLKNYAGQKAPHAIRRLWQNVEGKWGFETVSGRLITAELKGDSYITSFLIIMRFKTCAKKYNAVIFRDSLSDEDYRALTRRILFF